MIVPSSLSAHTPYLPRYPRILLRPRVGHQWANVLVEGRGGDENEHGLRVKAGSDVALPVDKFLLQEGGELRLVTKL
jgi:hypothetical protein